MYTLEQFIDKFGGKDAYPVINVENDAEKWPSFVVRYGDYAAIVQFMAVGTDEGAHLCIDVHPFVDGQKARASVFGVENGARYEGFGDAEVKGTSHGWNATQLVSVLVGAQADRAS